LNIKIVGLGGIGSILSDSICRFLNYSQFNDIEITLIDGDEYEYKNLERQSFSYFENKAVSKCKELKTKYKNITIKEFPQFINQINISVIQGGDIVLLGVDNHKTRKLISDYCSKLENIILISGGNELIDGNVQVYIRKDNKDITPSLTKYHPEIDNFIDKSPDEMSCEELEKTEPQLLFTNMMVSCFICSAFYNIVYLSKLEDFKISEIYFDIKTMCASSKIRKP